MTFLVMSASLIGGDGLLEEPDDEAIWLVWKDDGARIKVTRLVEMC